jgi:hypothetical protein
MIENNWVLLCNQSTLVLKQKIDDGAFSEVYLAERLSHPGLIAVKVSSSAQCEYEKEFEISQRL